MLDSVLSGLAANKEWGLITLLVMVVLLGAKAFLGSLTRTMNDRDRVNAEREERLIKVLVGFSDSLPKLANAIDNLRSWLSERFEDVNDDLEELKQNHGVIVRQVENHEERIHGLEARGLETHGLETHGLEARAAAGTPKK